MPADYKNLASDLEKAGDVSSEVALEIIRNHFTQVSGDANSLKNIIALRIFTDLASDYVFVKRSNITHRSMQIKNKVGGQALTSLRRRQRFVIESESLTSADEVELASATQRSPQRFEVRPSSSLSLRRAETPKVHEIHKQRHQQQSADETSKEMRRFTKLARGGHLVAKGGVLAESEEPNYYSSVYDTIPPRCWTPLGEIRRRQSASQRNVSTALPDVNDSSLRGNDRPFQRPPVGSFAEYVKSRR